MKTIRGGGLFLVLVALALFSQDVVGPTNLGAVVNSKYSEIAPIVSADGKTLYFTSDRPGGLGGQDGWMSKKVAGEWGEPENMGAPFNTEMNEGPDCFTVDEQTMYFTCCNRPDGVGMCDICVTYREGDKWSEPKNLGPPINTKYGEYNASISPDGKELYFVSTRPDGLGGYDIWVSHKQPDGSWGEPENLGPVINTPENEIYVFMHFDGVTLYFSSDGHGGLGSSDIFMSRKTPQGWTRPVNLGPTVNSPDKDIYFTIPASGDLAYFSSNRSDSLGLEDIYAIPVPQIAPPKGLTLVYGIVADKSTCAPPSIDPKLGIKVYDITTCRPVEAVIRIAESKTDKEIYLGKTKPDGSYKVILTAGADYNLSAYAKGYAFHSERFVVPVDQAYQEVEKNILLSPLRVGTVVILHNVYFDFDKAVLRPESKAELNNLIRLLRENPTMKVEIAGHTDSKGSDEYNIRLSRARAKAVRDYLVEVGGINPKRLVVVGYGESRPIASNATDEGRQLNRRVEFKILSR